MTWIVPAHAETVMPTETVTPKVITSLKLNIDGKGKLDRVVLTDQGNDNYQLTVTAAGKVSTATFRSPVDNQYAPSPVWGGVAALDGVKGKEIMVNLRGSRDRMKVYTWRKGKLRVETAPAGPWSGRVWHAGSPDNEWAGYRFFTSRHRRYVDVSIPKWYRAKTRIVRSQWKKGRWVKISSRSARLSNKQAGKYLGVANVKIVVGKFRANIDGKAGTEALTYDRFNGRYGVTMKIGKRSVKTPRLVYRSQDFYGAASLDGVRGDELVFFTDNSEYTWRVLTWRNGRFVADPSPWIWRINEKDWYCGEHDMCTFTFSTEGGKSYAVVATRGCGDGECDERAYFKKSVWTKGKWQKVAEGYDLIDQSIAESFRTGFRVDFIKP